MQRWIEREVFKVQTLNVQSSYCTDIVQTYGYSLILVLLRAAFCIVLFFRFYLQLYRTQNVIKNTPEQRGERIYITVLSFGRIVS